MSTNSHTDLPDANGVLPSDYHDRYVGDQSYDEAFGHCFSEKWVLDLVKEAFDIEPPLTLLDSGSANGLTLPLFAKAGVKAWGIENSPAMVARTPAAWKSRNLLGDVRKLPFRDHMFDVVYDTALPYVAMNDLDAAIAQIYRVTRKGFLLGGVVADMLPEVIENYQLLKGVQSALTLVEWSDRLQRAGFKRAVTTPEKIAGIWAIECNFEGGDDQWWYASAEDMAMCFYTK